MRLLMYSQDSMGLGHLRRNRNLAAAVLERTPDASVLVVADSPATPFFAPVPGVDYLKLPTIVKTGDAEWKTASLPVAVADAVRLRGRLILETFREFEPDIVLIDHMPVGALGELKPLLDGIAGSYSRPRLVLGLRDVLDSPDTIARTWTELDAYTYLARYDEVFIYGCREVYDAETAYDLGRHAPRVTYCHYVAPPATDAAPLAPEEEPFLLVMGGGGGDAFAYQRAALEGLGEIGKEVRLRALVVTGPHMPAAERRTLERLAEGLPAEVVASCDDLTTVLRRAAAVVTMAGYNSLAEVLRWRKRALVIPRAGPSREQRIRTRLFADRGLVRMLDPDTLTPDRMAAELVRLLRDGDVPDAARIPALDGADRAAARLLDADGASG